ncbi:hypothetical protein M902_3258 [Bacteriovorax sp. BAL6_X]|uniref:hypothetical protein n=1 Tax=Bacteriovorax sp. BAL6_X TaxID=1201290 RepID=UPI00038546E4|nr:hypothetical protein [Bacteriovorax sp. BAL6_X]EPZ50838.1 hypothetical protein M902_3258 [Bacteriovorax sp. BAL6_X]
MFKRISILLFLSSFFIMPSCSQKDIYTPLEMFDMAYKFDNTIEEVRIGLKEEERQLDCKDYPEGCIIGSPKRFKVRLVEMIVVQYMTSHEACLAAFKLNQYYARNWLFDDVASEPVLVDFVKQVYDAKNPQSKEDCN